MPLVLCLTALWCFNGKRIVWREYKCLWFCADCSVTFSSLHPIVIVVTIFYPFPWTRCSFLFVIGPSKISANYSDAISHRALLLILLVSSLFPFSISLDNNCGNFVNSFSTLALEHPVKEVNNKAPVTWLIHESRVAAKASISGYSISGFLWSHYKESHAKSDIYDCWRKTTSSFINQLYQTSHPHMSFHHNENLCISSIQR
jgi:hypothetical protein